MGTKHKWEIGYLNGAAFKMDQIAQYHKGELITSLKKCSLSQGSSNLLVYGTSSGSLGVFIPFENREVFNTGFILGSGFFCTFGNVFKARISTSLWKRPSSL
jgi:hypothetical protein